MKPRLAPRPARDNEHLHPPPWEVCLVSFLLVAIKARDRRIARLEELDYQKAVALDGIRRRAERRAA